MKIAVVGAGVAGLSAAAGFRRNGHTVQLFDKGRGAGGRLSTRRAQTPLGEIRFDHGAQFFTARDEGFRELLRRLETQNHVAEWRPRRAEIARNASDWTVTHPPTDTADPWYVGTPAMNALVKAMADGHDVSWGERALQIERRGGHSHIRFDKSGWTGPFDIVVLAIPAEQAVELLHDASPRLAREAAAAATAPCWSVMLGFERPLELSWDAGTIRDAPISWAARNSSKPGREGQASTWVLHASPEWTRDNLDKDNDAVAAALADLFAGMTGAPPPVFMAAHRWLYAKTERAANAPYGWDGESAIAVIGDWRIAPRVEAAWQSGHALADFLAD